MVNGTNSEMGLDKEAKEWAEEWDEDMTWGQRETTSRMKGQG